MTHLTTDFEAVNGMQSDYYVYVHQTLNEVIVEH